MGYNKIKEGWNGKPLILKIGKSSKDTAELWIDFRADNQPNKETLSYISLQELISLRDDINDVLNKMVFENETRN